MPVAPQVAAAAGLAIPLLIVVDSEGRIRLRGSASEQELKVLLDSLVQV